MKMELLEIESVKSSVSYPESVRSQTKLKFDALLKNALKAATPPAKSKNTEFNGSLEKLIDEDCAGVDNGGFTAPIPKPRKSRYVHTVSVESGESGGTYKVSSPKILGEKEDDAATYTKSPPKQIFAESNEQIGDILVHSTTTSPVIPVLERKTSHKDKNDDTSSSSILVVETKQQPEHEEEIIVKYEKLPTKTSENNETNKPKPKTRTKKKGDDGEKRTKDDNFEKITAVVIHRTDRLQLSCSLLMTHPLVSVHIINSESGMYLKKSDKNRAVTFYYEDKKFDYIAPILTQVYNMRNERSLIPQWEETLLFNEDFKYIVAKENNVIFLFEIVDFLTHSEANKKNASIGWQKIAWAFLKPISKDGFLNTGKRVRLQLYKPGSNTQECNVFQWWSKQKWKKYPGSLHVTVKGVAIPQNEETTTTMRSKSPLTAEIGSNEILESVTDSGKKGQEGDAEQKIKWRKIEHQACKMPNKCLVELETCNEGAFVVKFSNKGDFLAVAVVLNDVYTVKVFETETWDVHTYIPIHQSLIYNIVWSTNDDTILSASADCTVSLWDFTKNSFIQMLPHPSFVYTCNITAKNVIATGCYDKIIRIWKKSVKFVLRQELEKHTGYVTSLVFNRDGNLLYSADSLGVILEWIQNDDEWSFKRAIHLVDLKETIVNQILLCKRETKMIVHARDSVLRVVDLETDAVLHWMRGVLNNRIHTKCSLSPCGNFVTSGSENGFIQVWNIYTEKCVATYTPCDARTKIAIHDVQFHPRKHLMVFAHFGTNIPVFVYCYRDVENSIAIATDKNDLKTPQQSDSKLDFGAILCKIDQIIKMQT